MTEADAAYQKGYDRGFARGQEYEHEILEETIKRCEEVFAHNESLLLKVTWLEAVIEKLQEKLQS